MSRWLNPYPLVATETPLNMLVTVKDDAPLAIACHHLDVIRWERVKVDLTGTYTMDEALALFKDLFETVIVSHDPIPVIARVEFIGEIDLSFHMAMVSDIEYMKESVRSAALAAFGDRAWIEKVKVTTKPKGEATSNPGPLRELDCLVDELLLNEKKLLELEGELSSLFRQLPSDYRHGAASISLDDPGQMKAFVEQARVLLFQRLKSDGCHIKGVENDLIV